MPTTAQAEPSDSGPGRRRLATVVLGLLLLIGLGTAATYWLPLDEWLLALSDWGAKAGLAGALLVGLLFVPVCVFMLPATLLTYAMAFAFGLWPSVLGVEVGAVLGAAVVFLLGRHFVRDIVARNTEQHPLLGAFDQVLNERSFGLLVLIRMSPLFPFAMVGYALGASRAGFWRHLAATALAILPQVIVTCWIGSSVADLSHDLTGERAKSPLEYALFALGIAAALFVLGIISKRMRAALRQQLEAAEEVDSPST